MGALAFVIIRKLIQILRDLVSRDSTSGSDVAASLLRITRRCGGPRPCQTPRPEVQSKGRRVDVRGVAPRQVARPAASTSEGRVGRLIRPAAGVRAANGAVRRALTDKYT